MAVIKDLGAVTAYASAVEGGYTGTKEEFATLMASYATVAEEAADSAESASQSAESASASATTATSKANKATTAAQTATAKAGEASQSASQAQASATTASTKASEASQSATTASMKASEATTAASNATTAKDDAVTAKTAAQAAQTAAETAQGKAEDAAESVSASAAQIATNTSDISELKSALDEDESLLFDISSEAIVVQITPTMASGLCKADGSITESSNYEYTQIMPAKPGDTFHGIAIVKSGETASTDPCYIRYWTAYNGNTVVPDAGIDSGQLRTYTVPNGVNGIRMTLNLGLYNSGSLTVIRSTTEDSKTIKPELLTVAEQAVEKGSGNAVSGNAVYDFVITEKIGKNLIDKTKAVTGAVQSDGSITTNGSWANYKTSDYIPVTAGQSYKLYLADQSGQSTSTTRLIYCLFKSDKTPASYTNEIGVGQLTITPTYDGFIRVTCENTTSSYFANNLMLIVGTNAVPYENYDLQLLLNNDINLNNDKTTGNILWGKKWCPCGDSFTEYTNASFSNGKYAGKNKTYPYLIALRNDMEILSAFFMSGRTMAYPADHTFTNSLTCPTNPGYYQNIPEDVDYITIMLGINDCQHTGSGTTGDGEDATGVITLGTIDDNTTDTYYGAYNVVLGWLRENRPFAHVGIIVTNGTTRQDYTEAQIAVAKKWGYPTINLNGDDKTPAMIRCYNPNLSNSLRELIKQKQAVDYDGSQTGSVNTHPNWQTHEHESTFIENFLRSI